jgi:multicomponent Na+:H+ antiporter subunit G
MEAVRLAVALLALLAGTAFSAAGILGLLRLPDEYARLHATGKVSVFGVVFLTVAALAMTPVGWGKALFLIFFLLLTAPAASHSVTSAAYRIGLKIEERETMGQPAPESGREPAGPGD